jgi:hypothetical protein
MIIEGSEPMVKKFKDVFITNLEQGHGPLEGFFSITKTAPKKAISEQALSEEEAVFVKFSLAYYHFFAEFINPVVYYYKDNPKAKFYIEVELGAGSINQLLEFMMFANKIFDLIGVKYEYIILKNRAFFVKNLTIIDPDLVPLETFNVLYNFLIEHNILSKEKPFRKVYISRKKATADTIRRSANIKSYPKNEFDHAIRLGKNIRMFKESLLEKYFKSLGFEIIDSENLVNMFEKFKFFSEVRVLAGTTGAGLINIFNMRPEVSFIFEISVPMLTGASEKSWVLSIHQYYKQLSNIKKIPYFSIFSNRRPESVIDFIENNKLIKDFLAE